MSRFANVSNPNAGTLNSILGNPSRGFTYDPNPRGNTSQSRSMSESGEYLDPEQRQRIGQLYPLLLQRLLGLQDGAVNLPRAAAGILNAAGTGNVAGAANPALRQGFQFGPSANFGTPTNFGGVGPYPEITPQTISPQALNEMVNLSAALFNQGPSGDKLALEQGAAGAGQSNVGRGQPQWLGNLAQLASDSAKTQALTQLRYGAEQFNAQQTGQAQQANVERSRLIGDEDIRRRQLTSEDDFRRRQAGAAEGLEREKSTAQDLLSRLGLYEDSDIRRKSLNSENDLQRRQMQLQAQLAEQNNLAQREATILQQLGLMNRPRQQSRQQSQQTSGTGGYASRNANSNPFQGSLWS